jgi:hypothetical protein
VLGACTQRSICPAYQSAYIYDKDELRKKFSYFLEDSTPKMFTASKNKYLIAEPTSYRKKLRSMQTVAMKPVPVHVPDSLLNNDSVSVADLNRAARSIIDSTFIEDRPTDSVAAVVEDSTYVITKDKELRLLKYNGADSLDYDPVSGRYVAQKPKYYVKDVRLNIEQDNYMWYLRDNIVLPDVRLAKHQQANAKKEVATGKKKKDKKKGLGAFFKNLFKKKPKAQDSIVAPQPPKEQFDFIDSDSLTQNAPPTEEKPETKKGFFSPRKKKSKDNVNADAAIASPADKKNKSKGEQPDKNKDKKKADSDGF